MSSSSSAFTPFVLSRNFIGHSNDVRAVKLLDNESLVTASRDGKAILSTAGGVATTLVEGESFLNSITADSENSHVFVGSHDSSIICTNIRNGQQTFYMGHTANVSCLDCYGSVPLLASGSWDHTVRVWKAADSSVVLKGHQQNVWDVLFVNERRLLSASADKSIKLWDLTTNACIQTFEGHRDVVRSLALLDESQFVSTSNDGTLRIWSLKTGQTTGVLEGHTSFVYSVDTIGDSLLVSSGEDRTVRIWDWRNMKCLQTIVLPSISQWSVSANSRGDFAVGSSDSTARVFTQSKDRFASAEEIAKLDEAVKNSAFSENEIDESQISDPSVLSKPGKQEGQIAIVRNERTKAVEAHQYSGGTWTKIGDVVGQNQAPGSKRETYNGKQYDYVFDVDIKDGEPPLRLPFNNGENPYLVAEKFIADNQLPPTYVEQVVQFLIKNTEAKSFGSAAAAAPSPSPLPKTPTQPADATAADASEVPQVLKYSQPLSLKAFQAGPLLNALQKAADEHGDNLGPYDVESLLKSLPSSGRDLLNVSLELKTKWRENIPSLLPVMDLIRISIANASSIPYQVVWVNLIDSIAAELPKHTMLAVRGIANLVGRDDYDVNNGINKAMLSQAIPMIIAAESGMDALGKPLSVALATLALNIAIKKPIDADIPALIKATAPKVVQSGDTEAVYRLALAIGLRSVTSRTEAMGYKASWFDNAPKEERIDELLRVLKPRIN